MLKYVHLHAAIHIIVLLIVAFKILLKQKHFQTRGQIHGDKKKQFTSIFVITWKIWKVCAKFI